LDEPLVAIIVPVFNGADLLEGCIDSIRSQTYARWTLIVADNVSSDRSLEIAGKEAARDDRIRVLRHDLHLGMLENWNRGLAHAPEDAVYVKQLNVDDRLRASCLRRLVDVAEAHPEVGVVSAYHMFGPIRQPAHRHEDVQIVPGRDAAREVLCGGASYLAHPSVMLVRRAAVPTWPSFYDATGFPPGHPLAPVLPQADKEAFFDVLERYDLAFVPEVLADLRSAVGGSATDFAARVGAWHVGRIETILRHGDRFFDPNARRSAIRAAALKYLRSLAWRIARITPLRDPDFVQYQRLALAYLLPRLRDEDLGGIGLGLQLAARVLDSGVRVGGEARA